MTLYLLVVCLWIAKKTPASLAFTFKLEINYVFLQHLTVKDAGKRNFTFTKQYTNILPLGLDATDRRCMKTHKSLDNKKNETCTTIIFGYM